MKTMKIDAMGKKTTLVWVLAIGWAFVVADHVDAQRGRSGASGGGRGGGGGARPSMGRVGGGGGRPSKGSAGGAAHRPASRPQASRPNVQRPSMGNASRPKNASRPNIASRPSGGGFSPSGGRPNTSRPSTRPGRPDGTGIANRPSVRPPSNVRPVSRPSRPGDGIAGVNRPGNVNRPGPGGLNRPTPRPGNGNRPSTLPGNLDRPGIGGNRPGPGNNRPGGGGNRPGIGDIANNRPGGGGNRPGFGNVQRPTTLPGVIDRPGLGGNQPGLGGGSNRPGLGGGSNRPGIGDRPTIGGGNRPGRPNRPGIGNGNINIGNDISIGGGNIIGNRPGWNRPGWNRPGWDRPNWNRPDWGWGGGGWTGNWHDHCIDHHHHWYNGCWDGGYWDSNWYQPLAWGAVGWGLGSLTNGWGYGTAFYNPYYVASATTTVPAYDYSQPVVVNNYVSADSGAAEGTEPIAQESPASTQALTVFDEGLAQFKVGDYQSALNNLDAALRQRPGDPAVHEVRALTLFALGNYQSAAAALNSFLSSAPGMDWTTLSGLYGNVDDYTAQLRSLEQYCQSKPSDASAHFVLAYQYLAVGAKDDAVNSLRVVVENQPKDYTAKRMLDALSPPSSPTPATPPSAEETVVVDANTPETDLVGSWRARSGDTTIDLAITEDSQFAWKSSPAGQPRVELKGQLASSDDQLVLESMEHGAMAGSVKSLGPDAWQFALSGAPPSDPGLSFARLKN